MAGWVISFEGGVYGVAHGVELVVGGDLFQDQAVVVLLIDHEMAQQVEQAGGLAHAAQQHLQWGEGGRGQVLP
jgi:hypothetical protein